MESSEYTTIRQLEDFHWWYASTHRAVMHELKKLPITTRVLDAGCGTGGLLALLQKSFNVAGFDSSPEGIWETRQRRGLQESVAFGSIESIPFQDNYFAAVTCIDVIYHASVIDDRRALQEMHRVLKPGGYLVLQVPAFECLRGGHDEVVHVRKRYRADEIRSLLNGSGYKVVKIFYRYPWLFVPALFIRKWTRGSQKSDLRPINPVTNLLLLYLSHIFDSRLFSPLPFGTSVFAVARRI